MTMISHRVQRTDVPFTSSAIAEVLYKTLFHPKPSREVVESMTPMPIGAIALASTAVRASNTESCSANHTHYRQILNALQEYKTGTHSPIDFRAETYKKAYDALKTKWSQLTRDRPRRALAIRNWMMDYCLYVSPITLVLCSLNLVETNVA
jgi:hypothetical protein